MSISFLAFLIAGIIIMFSIVAGSYLYFKDKTP